MTTHALEIVFRHSSFAVVALGCILLLPAQAASPETPPPPAIPKEVIVNWQIPDGPELTTAFITKWGANSPAAAGRWLAAQPDSPARHAGAETLAELWARTDLHAATQWALTLPDEGIVKSVVFDRLAALWAEKDPLTATGYFAKLPAGELRTLGAAALFEKWSQRDPAGLHAALGKIPATIADDARTSLAPVLFPRNATAAMDLLCEVKDGPRRIAAISQLFDYWRRRNRGASAAWLAQSPLSAEEREQVSAGRD